MGGFKTKHVMGILGDRYIYRYDMILQYVMFLFLIFFDITLSDVSDIIPGHRSNKDLLGLLGQHGV